MSNGYIMVPRSLFRDEIWRENRVYSKSEAYIWLLQEAAWKEKKVLLSGFQTFDLKRGDVVFTARELGRTWSWSKNKVLRFINFLNANNLISSILIVGNHTRITMSAICPADEQSVTNSRTADDCETNAERPTLSPELQQVTEGSGTPLGHPRDTFGTPLGHPRDTFGTPVERQYNEDVEERKERKERKEEEEGGAVPAPAPVPKIGVDDPEALRARIGAQAAQMWIDGFAAQAKTPVHAEQILRWAQHKKEIRKPVVGWSEFSALVKSFNQVTISKATAVVDYSVSNGYAGLFWDRDDPGAAKKEDPTGHIAVIIDPKKYEKYDKLKELPAAQRYSWDAIIAIDNESVAGG